MKRKHLPVLDLGNKRLAADCKAKRSRRTEARDKGSLLSSISGSKKAAESKYSPLELKGWNPRIS
jgi:hypothetical protein